VVKIAKAHAKTVSQIVFRFTRQLGMLPLTGTTSEAHMREDLAIEDFTLSADEMSVIEAAG
jgi:diketogulonate reductase-like aldo/keto reductase